MNQGLFVLSLLCSLSLHVGLAVGLYSWGTGRGAGGLSSTPVVTVSIAAAEQEFAGNDAQGTKLSMPINKAGSSNGEGKSSSMPSAQYRRIAEILSEAQENNIGAGKRAISVESRKTGSATEAGDKTGLQAASSPVSAALLGISAHFPLRARQRGQQGQVLCRAFLHRSGRVEQIQIVRSSGYQLLDSAAQEALAAAYLSHPFIHGRRSIDVLFQFELR